MAGNEIDRDKLRAAIRKLLHEDVYYLLDKAIELLPQTKLLKLVSQHIDPEKFRPDGNAKGSLLATVRDFEKASLAGEYYASFDVNSKNFMDLSGGTTAWIAECHRLLDRCVAEDKKGNPAEVRRAFDIIFGLLDHIGKGVDDVIFFADEAGSWQVGVSWERILPFWFKVLSATAARMSSPNASRPCLQTTAASRAPSCFPLRARQLPRPKPRLSRRASKTKARTHERVPVLRVALNGRLRSPEKSTWTV